MRSGRAASSACSADYGGRETSSCARRIQIDRNSEYAPLEEIPKGRYGAILPDPPWGFQFWNGSNKLATTARLEPYSTMEMPNICSLPIAELAAPDCVLLMWVVWPTLPEAINVIGQWGFEFKTCGFMWLKADPYRLFTLDEDVYMGMGYWIRANLEACLLATYGRPKRLKVDIRQGIVAPRREHSRKPDGIHDRIEWLVAGSYLELFARQKRLGWDCWGNQTDKCAPVEAAE